jgi:hypothetical protein
VNHGFCRICGTLLNPYAKECTACGFENDFDFDQFLPVDDNFPDGVYDLFNTEGGLGQNNPEEDSLYPG